MKINDNVTSGRQYLTYENNTSKDTSESAVSKDPIYFFYNELNEINIILINPLTTEEQALYQINRYNNLINSDGYNELISGKKNKLTDRIKELSENISDYLIKKEMITFGYFVDRMDVASKYGHDLSVKCYRDGFSQYTEFYKNLTKLLSSYGEYSAGVIDDGKKTKFKQNLFYYNLHMALMKYYPVTGDLKNNAGEDCSIYKGRFEIDTSHGMDNCSIYIDGKLIDSNINYSDSIKKMEYFFSVMNNPVSGTQVIKKINTETDRYGKLVKVTGMADVIAMPDALLRWLDIFIKKEDYDEINSFFDKSMDKLKEFSNFNKDYLSVASLYRSALKKTNDIFDAKLNASYFEKARLGINEEWHLDQGKINSYNTIIDGIKKELQMTLDEFSQRYNTINSNYDNMLRVITTMISELAQELKGFLRI